MASIQTPGIESKTTCLSLPENISFISKINYFSTVLDLSKIWI